MSYVYLQVLAVFIEVGLVILEKGLLWLFFVMTGSIWLFIRGQHILSLTQTSRGRYPWLELDEPQRSKMSQDGVRLTGIHKATIQNTTQQRNPKIILFYNPSNFQLVRNLTNITYTFEHCAVKNCRVTFDPYEANVSDAVIIHWFRYKRMMKLPKFVRPKNQVWIFIQHEPTRSYARNATIYPNYEPGMRNSFNWTMTYSRRSDIFLPYGKLVRKPKHEIRKRDYLKIAKSKTRDAIWVVSQCNTYGKREQYVNILKQYIDIEILGACGKNWTCGVRSNHPLDKCFDILNTTYRYFLAFENDYCSEYVSEKFYENFEYDLLQVVRAGMPRKKPLRAEKDTYISAHDFRNAHELGRYLRNLSSDVVQYAKMLAKKDRYKVIPYQELFLDSMCNICKRLHHLDHSKFVYDDVYKWIRKHEPCHHVMDLD